MSGSSSEDEGIPYETLFLKAISSTRSHMRGTASQTLVSSIMAPNAFWTGADKELFFHGLSRYSRLRPDLIASHIGNGKTAVDVMSYITNLEEGLKSTDTDNKKVSLPSARCVSKKWIKFEEEQAFILARKEIESEHVLRSKERARMLKEGRNRIRKVKEMGFVRNVAARNLEQERRAEWELQAQEQQLSWDQEDALNTLGYHEFAVLDSLIRNAEDPDNASREASARAETAPPDGEEQSRPSSPENLANMNPAERRRYQKRLHMRKKRAEATGKEVVTDKARLRPGRKTARPQPLDNTTRIKSSPSTRASSRAGSFQGSENEAADRALVIRDGSDDSEDEDAKNSRSRGLTVAQQIQVRFAELDITIEALQKRGLDLFNLGRFHGLSNMFAESLGRSPTQSISAHTLELLRAVLDEFLHSLLHHIIVLAEEERTMKEHTKVWRGQLNDIKPYHVKDALQIMGMQAYQTKAPLLARLNAALGGDEEVETPPSPEGREHPQHTEIYAPLIYHLSLTEPDNTEIQDVLLLSDDEDTANIRARAEGMSDLAREVAQEAHDEKLDQRHEAYLWRLMRGEDPETGSELGDDESMKYSEEEKVEDEDETMAEDEEDGDEDGREDEEVRSRLVHGARGGPNPLRLVAPGGEVKSQAFILDSDEDEKGTATMSE